jgi:hypothetical protein
VTLVCAEKAMAYAMEQSLPMLKHEPLRKIYVAEYH